MAKIRKTNPTDTRRRDYEPKTDWQKWLKAKLDANTANGTEPQVYQSLHAMITSKGVEIAENYLYRLVRGDPEKYKNARQPSYNVALAVGEVMGDVNGSLTAANFNLPKTPTTVKIKSSDKEDVRIISPDSIKVLDAYENLKDQDKRAVLEHARALARAASEDFHERTDIIGKRSDHDERPVEIEDDSM